MEHTTIPGLQKQSSRIGLGRWAIGGWMWGGTDEKASIATIERALELGINLIDTAPVYGLGICEEIVGKALKQSGRRSEAIIATKVGLSWQGQNIYRDARKEVIAKEIESSLKKLQVDQIDLYQLHWPDEKTPVAETAQALKQLLDQGKIAALGVSNFNVEQMEEFQKYAPIHSLQSPFNVFERQIENKQLAYCLDKKIATLGYGSLCRGLLSGKMSKERKFQGDDIRKRDPKFQPPTYDNYLKAVDKLENFAKDSHNKSLLALALRYSLDKGISIPLWGARKPEQLEPVEDAWGWKLNEEDFKTIDQILAETISDPAGPGFMAPPARNKAAA